MLFIKTYEEIPWKLILFISREMIGQQTIANPLAINVNKHVFVV